MSQPITAEVVEAPKPVRPELWIPLVREDNGWWTYGCDLTKEEALDEVSDKDHVLLVRVPASTAAPEPDWVAEACDCFDATVRADKPSRGYRCFTQHGGEMRTFFGPTPALAAKACVERLRNQTPNPAACGGSE